ncbi:hypothetical protein BK762_20110 [Bacillus thuringiensis serovar toumanoffi]|nr:hypothetical protein BK762_20110 [Bacillus thuringiensis serovar toumanoffi]
MEQVRYWITILLILYTFIRWDIQRSPFLSGSAYNMHYRRKKLQCWALGHWWVHVKTEHGYYMTHETYLCPVCGGKYLYHH